MQSDQIGGQVQSSGAGFQKLKISEGYNGTSGENPFQALFSSFLSPGWEVVNDELRKEIPPLAKPGELPPGFVPLVWFSGNNVPDLPKVDLDRLRRPGLEEGGEYPNFFPKPEDVLDGTGITCWFREDGISKAAESGAAIENLGYFGDVGFSEQESFVTSVTGRGTRIIVASTNNGVMNPNGREVYNEIGIERADGFTLVVPMDRDVRINDGEDGSLSLYFPDSGEMMVYDAHGNVTTSFLGESSIVGTEGDDVFVNVSGKQVNMGEGNDTVFNMADGASIDLGAGNNTFYQLGGRSSVHLTAGNGNNTIAFHGLENSGITLGNGDNTVTGKSYKGDLTTGAGSTHVHVAQVNGHFANGMGTTTFTTHNFGPTFTNMQGGTMRVKSHSFGARGMSNGDMDITAHTGSGMSLESIGGRNRIHLFNAPNSKLDLRGSHGDEIFIYAASQNIHAQLSGHTAKYSLAGQKGSSLSVGDTVYLRKDDPVGKRIASQREIDDLFDFFENHKDSFFRYDYDNYEWQEPW